MWTSFMLFATIILVLLWLFQYVLLEAYYETMKCRDLDRAADTIEDSLDSDDYKSVVRDLALKNSLTIVVTDWSCNVVCYENTLGSYSIFENDILNNFNRYLYSLRNRLNDSGKDSISIKPRVSGNDDIQRIIHVTSEKDSGGKLYYIFIESSVEPIDATARIIKEQLTFITIILFELALIITVFLSNRITRPLTKLTESAEKFAKGDYDVRFDGNGYAEVKQLSDVLNTAGEEISKVASLRHDLIANVSHDLRTPLTIIKSYAEMIRDLSGDNPEKREEHLGVIIDEADRLSGLVNNILELSKLENSERTLVPEKFSLHEKMEQVLSRYTLLNENDGYNITFEKQEDVTCYCDIAAIEQVLYNLINNAVNYCGEDKTVIIKQINKDDCVRMEIIDHGEGIDEKLLPQIFDRYYRAPKAKRDVIGTGLGLSIVKTILHQHGFPFGVSSVVGEGSVFWFEMALSNDRENSK